MITKRSSNTTKEYEKIGENICKVALTYLPTHSAKAKLYDITQKIAAVLYEQYMKCQPLNVSLTQPKLIKNPPIQVQNDFENHSKIHTKSLDEPIHQAIENIDIEKMVEKVKEETENTQLKNAEGTEILVENSDDDDISSTDSENERKIMILKKNEEKKKRKAKGKHRKKKKKSKPNENDKKPVENDEEKSMKNPPVRQSPENPKKILKFRDPSPQPVNIKKPSFANRQKSVIQPNDNSPLLPAETTPKADNPLKVRSIISTAYRQYNLRSVLRDNAMIFRQIHGGQGIGAVVDLSLQGLKINKPIQKPKSRDATNQKKRIAMPPTFEELFPSVSLKKVVRDNTRAISRHIPERRPEHFSISHEEYEKPAESNSFIKVTVAPSRNISRQARNKPLSTFFGSVHKGSIKEPHTIADYSWAEKETQKSYTASTKKVPPDYHKARKYVHANMSTTCVQAPNNSSIKK